MKTYISPQFSLVTIALAAVCLPLCGCGGSSPGVSPTPAPTPDYDALYAPYVGSYAASWTDTATGTQHTLNLALAIGKGKYDGSGSTPAVTATWSQPQNLPEGSTVSTEWNDGKAYLRLAMLDSTGSQISDLYFVFVPPGKSKVIPLYLDLNAPDASGGITGTLGVGDLQTGGEVNGVIASYTLVLAKQ